MRQQSSPTLFLLSALAAVFITPCTLHAQPAGNVSDEPPDPPAPTVATTGSKPNPVTASDDDLMNPSKFTPAMRLEFSIEALNGVLMQYRQVGDRKCGDHTLSTIVYS